VSEPAVPGCPECGELRAADGTPACSCARRASEAHRETRTAQAAAAEDFDPVRIRAFVEIDVDSGPLDASAARTEGAGGHADEPVAASTDDAEKQSEEPQRPGESGRLGGDACRLPAEDTPSSSPLGIPPLQPLSEGAPERRRRHRALVVTGVGAAVAVLVTGGIVGGLFWYDGPSREDSVSDGVRAGLPDGPPPTNVPSSLNPSRTGATDQSSATSTSSPGATSAGSQATATGTGAPSGSAPSATATGTSAPSPSESGGRAPVLRLGDKGPEVVELQLRLRQVGFYDGDADGVYDSAVENAVRGYQLTRVILQDESGVYGAATRDSLESETEEP
jgi:hypothetical protein